MPYSLILNLIPLSSISPQYVSGRHLHALFLTLVSTIDRDLGDRLHHSESDKAFTLSPLQTKKSVSQLQWEHHHSIPKGTPC